MKKLISIGVALALLTMVVVPGAVAAQCDYEGITPTTYAKIPFTIIGSGFYLLEGILQALVDAEFLPANLTWLPALMPDIGDWAMGPLAWTVDMLGWGLSLGASVWALADTLFEIGMPGIGDILDTLACSVFQPFSCNVTGADFDPCD